ncbi:hypothetical protein CXIVA_07910 [Clostridium sp. SY8519]|nr:hypothetical protein [Clostridium sp. SY8519]BAK46758.1 hypothetical protein CXIVA_07910 [Clostridium sp. SY8519]
MQKKVELNLEILLLNDLYNTGVIDQELYEKALSKLNSTMTEAA